MQQRLAKADFILRGILKSGDLKVRTLWLDGSSASLDLRALVMAKH